LPQVAADYRINSYFCDHDGIHVNLYIPSTVRWTHDGARISLTQRSEYPFEGTVRFDVTVSRTMEFTIHLRIPAWAEGASIAVNGKTVPTSWAAGKFATIRRTWRNGDRVEMDLPMRLRLEAIDAQHPQTVALLCGPLVLFAITDVPPVVTARQLLAARRIGRESWQAETAVGTLKMLPFTAIADQQYSTYLSIR
jgi:DUF1680 family protein